VPGSGLLAARSLMGAARVRGAAVLTCTVLMMAHGTSDKIRIGGIYHERVGDGIGRRPIRQMGRQTVQIREA